MKTTKILKSFAAITVPTVTCLTLGELVLNTGKTVQGSHSVITPELSFPEETLQELLPRITLGSQEVSLEPISKKSTKFSYLDTYDSIIDSTLSYFEDIHGFAPDRNLVRAIIAVESGSPRDRKGAFFYDPMQIANRGDHALEVLARGKEFTHLIGDFSDLNGKNHTPWRQGQWDYSNSNMDAEASILGGVGWLLHKAAKYDKRSEETGHEMKEYTIRQGDSYFNLALKLNTTIDTLKKYNPGVDPKKLGVGQTINFKEAREEMCISGWKDWGTATKNVNGGGNPTYLPEVLAVKRELDRT